MAGSVPHPCGVNHGGYDCKFVSPPPSGLPTDCPICLQILKEPCLISCSCGRKICRECIEQIKKDNKPCPMCNKTEFTYLQDNELERSLKELEIWCTSKKAGCDWKGKLGEYEQHLNKNPSPENQLIGCQFVEVKCKHGCGESFQRRHITAHQKGVCQKRPYTCEYCHEYESTFEDVTKNHYHQCKKFPVTCPNKCREAPFVRQMVENHVKEECVLTEVNCPLHYAGCEVRLPRKNMPEHMRDTVTHLTLLATVTQTLLKENQKMQQHIRQLEVKQSITEGHYQEQKATEKDVAALKKDICELRRSMGGYPIDFHVNYAIQKDQYLPSFDTHSHGYQMCIRVDTNGSGPGKGTHVSIYTCLMRGPYDEHLKWPFRGEITIQIVNQAGDHSHVEETNCYNDETPDSSAGRVTNNKGSCGWGFHQFLAHTHLEYNAAKQTQYLKDNIIIVRVVRVKITQ